LNAGCRVSKISFAVKICYLKVIHCVCQPNEVEWEIKKKLGWTNRGSNVWGPWPTQAPLRRATGSATGSIYFET